MVRRSLIGVALQSMEYRIIPVIPVIAEVLGEPSRKSPLEITEHVDVVQVSRPASDAASVAADGATIGAAALWLQQGIRSPQARQLAITAGLDYVEDKCLGTIGATMHFSGSIGRR